MRRVLPILLTLAVVPPGYAGAAQQAAKSASPAESAEYHFLQARHLEGAGRVDDAIAALKRALALAPKSAELRAELAGLYARQDRVVDALATAEEAVQYDPRNVEANKIIGSIYAALADQKRPLRPGDDPARYAERALAALEIARGTAGTDLNVEFSLGRLYVRRGDHERAITALGHVFEQQPQYSEGGMLLAAAQEAAGRIQDATATLEGTIQHNPAFFRAYGRLIELYEQQRRWKDAADAYAAAQEVNPRADLLRGRVLALMNSGQHAEAQGLLRKALAQQPAPDPALQYLLAESQRRSKDYPAALATIEKLRAADPGRAAFVYQHAQILEDSGRPAEAERELRQLLTRDPNDANALNALGYMFAERGERLDEAVTLVQRALKVEPDNPSFLDSLGWAFFKQGKLELADAPLSQAAQRSPENSVIQEHLGDLRARQQRYAEAVLAWERALAGDGDSIDRSVIEKKLSDARARIQKK